MNEIIVKVHWTIKFFDNGKIWWRRQTCVARASFIVNAKSVTGYTVTVWAVGASFGGRGTGCSGVGGACLNVRKVVVVVFRSNLWCGTWTKFVKFWIACRCAATGSATFCVIGKPTATSTRAKSFVDNAPGTVVAVVQIWMLFFVGSKTYNSEIFVWIKSRMTKNVLCLSNGPFLWKETILTGQVECCALIVAAQMACLVVVVPVTCSVR